MLDRFKLATNMHFCLLIHAKGSAVIFFCFEKLAILSKSNSCCIDLDDGIYRIHREYGSFILQTKKFKIRSKEVYIEVNNGDMQIKEKYKMQIQLRSMYNRYEACLNLFWANYWIYLHTLSIAYPDKPNHDDKLEMKKLLEALYDGNIPCPHCQQHFCEYVDTNRSILEYDKHFADQRSCINFFVDLHNDINQRNDKRIYEVDEALRLFDCAEIRAQYNKIINMFEARELAYFPIYFAKNGIRDILAENKLISGN